MQTCYWSFSGHEKLFDWAEARGRQCLSPWNIQFRDGSTPNYDRAWPVQQQSKMERKFLCELEVLVDSHHQICLYNKHNTTIKLNSTSHTSSYKRYNGCLVRKSFQPKELCTVKLKLMLSTLPQKKDFTTGCYKSLDWILMHQNSVPSWMLEQGHTCSSIKIDNTVFPSAPQAQQLDLMTAWHKPFWDKNNQLSTSVDRQSTLLVGRKLWV